MSPRARLLAVGALVAVAVTAFLLLRPSTPEPGAGGATADDPPASARTDTRAGGSEGAGEQREEVRKTRTAAPVVRVTAGAPAGGVQTITARQGERVRFSVKSDRDDEIHVHGFDIERPVKAGTPTRFDFPARITGVFEVELHSDDRQIASVKVEP